MSIAERRTYFASLVQEMSKHWPDNRTVNLVFHGHSVPAGYFATPLVDTFQAYPHLLHRALKERFPYAVINAIVTAVGGEHSRSGSRRFRDEVLTHRPDAVLIDYGLNDRGLGLRQAEAGWRHMIEAALAYPCRVVLLTPTWDNSGLRPDSPAEAWTQLAQHAEQIRGLAEEYETALADSFAVFERYAAAGGDPTDLLSWSNHPNRRGHDKVCEELLRWFAYV